MSVELLPCPFCGETPDHTNPHTFATTVSGKWGAVHCCITGPEVRTGFMPLAHWQQRATDAWNERAVV